MTPKQTLRKHLDEMHKFNLAPPDGYTLVALQNIHGHLHHHYATSHYHQGENSGPGKRPPGWKTGEGAVKR